MKNKFQKIITTAVLSAVSLTTIACGSCNNKLSKAPINVFADKEKCCIYEASATTPQKQIGKIVETSTQEDNLSSNFFMVTSSPYMTFSNDDDSFIIKFNFLNQQQPTIQNENINEKEKSKLASLMQKQSILTIYTNELYNNNVNLTTQNKIDIINEINNLKQYHNQTKTTEKLDMQIQSIDKINNIFESNLNVNSKYYQSNLNNIYNDLSSKIVTDNNIELNQNSSNQEIANNLLCSLGMCENKNEITKTTSPQTKISNINKTSINNELNTNNQTIQNQAINDQNNNLRRVPNSIRRRRNIRNNQINSSTYDSNNLQNQNNLNNYKDNNMQDNHKTMRADRSQDTLSNEEYTSQNINNANATRVPYRATNINFQK